MTDEIFGSADAAGQAPAFPGDSRPAAEEDAAPQAAPGAPEWAAGDAGAEPVPPEPSRESGGPQAEGRAAAGPKPKSGDAPSAPGQLTEDDVRAKENAGEIKRGKVEDLFPGFVEEFSVTEVLPLGKGGILSGLGEIGGGGFSFSYRKISFLQSTIELCEHFQISPYALHSKGAFLLRLEKGEDFACLAREKGIEASCIGRFHAEKKRIRKDEYGESYLYKQETDSLEEIFTKEEIEILT